MAYQVYFTSYNYIAHLASKSMVFKAAPAASGSFLDIQNESSTPDLRNPNVSFNQLPPRPHPAVILECIIVGRTLSILQGSV